MSDGKAPDLSPFAHAIADAVRAACKAAYRTMAQPQRKMKINAAAYEVMSEAYRRASGDGRYPAHARQIMYAARPRMLELTGRHELDDKRFTQCLLPDYMGDHPAETADWDVVYDARGDLTEPHTQIEVPLGTIGVRDYLDQEAAQPSTEFPGTTLYSTAGPENRYSSVLFTEKEGFHPLLRKARIPERYDIALMTTKGMSTVAARELLDGLVARGVEKVLVLHDFDVNGFSIFGTLGTDNRRYSFSSKIKLIDIGLRLQDIEEMDLQSEPVETKGDWEKRADTLRRHGARKEEIDFLESERVELNAMTSDSFVEFVERKLEEHGGKKIIPADEILEAQGRNVLERALVQQMIADALPSIKAQVAAAELPADLREQVEKTQLTNPELPWDMAVAHVVGTAP
jgi:hypothetical protein